METQSPRIRAMVAYELAKARAAMMFQIVVAFVLAAVASLSQAKLARVAGLFAFLAFIAMSQMASAQVTLPDTGVDISEYVTAAATVLGAAVATVIGVFFAYRIIKITLRWTGKIGG